MAVSRNLYVALGLTAIINDHISCICEILYADTTYNASLFLGYQDGGGANP